MQRHDPYTPIIAGLRQWNSCDTEEKFLERLRLTRDEVRNLRIAYRSCPCQVDYSAENTRAAYLLAYYPHYIEIVYNELCKIHESCYPATWNEEAICGSFLGGGPCPEIIGWLAFLQERFPNIRKVTAYVFDKYAESWKVSMSITQELVAPRYWDGILEICPIAHDLTDWDCFSDRGAKRAIAASDFVVMQNCLNDYPGTKWEFDDFEQIVGNLERVVDTLPYDSIFMMSDLPFDRVKTVYREVARRVSDRRIADVAVPISQKYHDIRSNIIYPEVLKHLFIGEDGLIARKDTKYYSMSLYKPFIF